ncbi:hypothetical protein [Jeotgalibacillus aurantiacus]|uniref:hypothetical protein n=1 Tax=Jeotgalibacillus aurantiacus TaxID=2763266 RepID=UPI001D0A441A|nr:hypothetical protein [Jeotgalibacillus aurantiacus]
MDLRKLDLFFSIILLINSFRIFYLIINDPNPEPFNYMILFFSTVGAVILFMNSRRIKMKNKEQNDI